MNTIEHIVCCLGEEGSEIAHICSKANRFGLDDRSCLDPSGPTNRERLIAELNDLMGVARLAADNGIIPHDWMDADSQEAKLRKAKKFMRYAVDRGTLAPKRRRLRIG